MVSVFVAQGWQSKISRGAVSFDVECGDRTDCVFATSCRHRCFCDCSILTSWTIFAESPLWASMRKSSSCSITAVRQEMTREMQADWGDKHQETTQWSKKQETIQCYRSRTSTFFSNISRSWVVFLFPDEADIARDALKREADTDCLIAFCTADLIMMTGRPR